jgi:NAD(P)-dependent dehydrogenase (short-subunit alcohol dehydrogenase family)
MDVTDTGSVIAAADLAVGELGGLDVWVNNAGVYPNVPILDMTDEEWDQVMAVNLRGVFAGSREAARRMIAAGRGGVIVNVASLAGFRGVSPGLAAYATSKHGVRGTTRQMALELAPHGIRVLAVAPGFSRTEGNVAMLEERPEIYDLIPTTRASRLGRVGEPDDIGRVILFCASDMSMFMSCDTLLVDAAEAA